MHVGFARSRVLEGGEWADDVAEPVTSVTPTARGETYLVSTLDSTLRLIDRADGRCLQTYKDADYTNTTYRIRSTLAGMDAFVLSGSEDGSIFAWDTMSGKMLKRLKHGVEGEGNAQVRGSRKVVSAIAARRGEDEWASAGGDGEFGRLGIIAGGTRCDCE